MPAPDHVACAETESGRDRKPPARSSNEAVQQRRDQEMNATGLPLSVDTRGTEASDGIRTRALSPAIGAEIIGVDVSKPMSDELFVKILNIWHQSLVILLRNQDLTEDDQVRFGKRFGAPASRHTQQPGTGNPAVMLISNIRENGQLIGALPDGEMHFHSDQCHQERPATASMLYSLEIPSKGGNTLFANAYLAYETLPASIKNKIEGRKALNAYDYENASTFRGTKLREGIPSYWHPIVRTHPATGRKALYVNRLMTIAIEDTPASESEELLKTLFDHQERPEFIYEHVWRPHDVLLWDNRCALHARTDFSADERRLMRRLTILGERPF
jgi:taurine dioxygenase